MPDFPNDLLILLKDLITRLEEKYSNDNKELRITIARLESDIINIRMTIAESKGKVSILWAVASMAGGAIITLILKFVKFTGSPP